MSHLPSSLAGGRRGRNQPKQAAIIETNAARYERPIVWKCRWLDGWLGMYEQTNFMLNDGVGLAKYAAPSELQMHWALRIGPYLYELITNESMGISWRYVDETRWESWKSATPDRVVGETCATDTELAQMAEEVISQMQCGDPGSSSPTAKYNFVRNNCHTFALRLLENTINSDVGALDMRAFAGYDVGTVGTSASPAFAGWRKMNAVSSHHSVPELWGSLSAYLRAVSDMAKGKLRERHFEVLLPDYQGGAVAEERSSIQALIAAVYGPSG